MFFPLNCKMFSYFCFLYNQNWHYGPHCELTYIKPVFQQRTRVEDGKHMSIKVTLASLTQNHWFFNWSVFWATKPLSVEPSRNSEEAKWRVSFPFFFLLCIEPLISERACDISISETVESTPKIDLSVQFELPIAWLWLVISLWSVFLQQNTKFSKSGVNIVWTLAWSSDGRKKRWWNSCLQNCVQGPLMKLVTYEEVFGGQLQRRKHGYWQRRCIKLKFDCLTIHFFMSEATICLTDGKREVRRNSLKLLILWIRKRGSSVHRCRWMIQVEELAFLNWMNFGKLENFLKDLALSPAAVYWEKKSLVKICSEKWKIRELLRAVLELEFQTNTMKCKLVSRSSSRRQFVVNQNQKLVEEV